MTYLIYKDGVLINRIAAGESFCRRWCAENGCTYELESEPEPEPIPDAEPQTTMDRLAAAYMEGVNGA